MTADRRASFPDLSAAKTIAVDIETRDDDLRTKGPGVRRGAYIVGVAVGTDDGFRGYYPVAHGEGPNLDATTVFRWLKRELGRTNQPKCGANLLYDADFLAQVGVEMKGPWRDVQVAEPLIDENARGHYNLDDIAEKYLHRGKTIDAVAEECARRGYKGDPRKHLWKLPASLIGPYAVGDVDLPLAIFPKQRKILRKEETWELFAMESDLSPLLLQMRRRGVRLDERRLDKAIHAYERKLDALKKRLNAMTRANISYWAADSIAKAFDELGLPYALTAKTRKPSFTKELLRDVEHPIGNLIMQCRAADKFVNTFLRGQMRDQMIDGRVHCLFNQLKSDDFGTVTGRLSSSHPNLQFIPGGYRGVRDVAHLCRSIFIPEEGCQWGKADYSQVEFRIFAHYALGRGAEEFRAEYRKNPLMDYHQWCADEAGTERGPAKTANFAVVYGIGQVKLAAMLEMSLSDVKEFLERYHGRLPFARHTMKTAADRAARRGYIRTIMNRRRRFNKWEPADWELSQRAIPVADKQEMTAFVREAIKRARARGDDSIPRLGVRRAKTYKALNALIQGSAADLMKKAMVDGYKAGVFDAVPLHLTVHDELDNSVPQTPRGKEAWAELAHIMESAIPFRVPVVVDASLGKNWGKLE